MSATAAMLNDDRELGAAQPRWMLWAGRVVSALPILMLLMSATMKLSQNPNMLAMMVNKFGYASSAALGLGVLELVCVVLYAIPRTAVFGAILVTAYLGGAVATHVRVGDVFFVPVVLGVLVWIGLYLRDARLRALLPLRHPAP
ncbi:MAG: rane protein [bacterium]|nr:rane protein [bacterium]